MIALVISSSAASGVWQSPLGSRGHRPTAQQRRLVQCSSKGTDPDGDSSLRTLESLLGEDAAPQASAAPSAQTAPQKGKQGGASWFGHWSDRPGKLRASGRSDFHPLGPGYQPAEGAAFLCHGTAAHGRPAMNPLRCSHAAKRTPAHQGHAGQNSHAEVAAFEAPLQPLQPARASLCTGR